jgi:hypothetical protein
MKYIFLLILFVVSFSSCEKEEESKLPAIEAQLQGEWFLANQSGGIIGKMILAGDKTIEFNHGTFTTTYNTAKECIMAEGSYEVFRAESFVYNRNMYVISFAPKGGIRTLLEIENGRLIITEDTPDGYVYVYERKKPATK